MNENKYYTLVTNRISEVEKELESIENDLSNVSDSKSMESLNLAREVLRNKISYLRSIELLPLYVSLQSFKNIKMYDKISKQEVSFEEVQRRLGLLQVKDVLSRNKITTLEYLKELFINDYSNMYDLISLQSINFMCKDKIQSLYNQGENSIAQILIRERQLCRLENKVNEDIKGLEIDYDFDTLKEINHYKRNSDEKLSFEFILKHKDKVTHNNPEMEKVIKKLNRKEKFKFISKFFKTKRSKEEIMFVNSVIDFYNNDSRISSLGLSRSEDLFDNTYTIKKFIKNLNKKVSFKRRELNNIKKSLASVKSSTLSEIKKYETISEEKKKDFITLLKSKTNFLPKMFGEQLWNEPGLKSSLIKVSCISEEKSLLDEISTWSTPIAKEYHFEQCEIEPQVSVRKLIA